MDTNSFSNTEIIVATTENTEQIIQAKIICEPIHKNESNELVKENFPWEIKTMGQGLKIIAGLGGHQGAKWSSPPGPQIIWEGTQVFTPMVKCTKMFKEILQTLDQNQTIKWCLENIFLTKKNPIQQE